MHFIWLYPSSLMPSGLHCDSPAQIHQAFCDKACLHRAFLFTRFLFSIKHTILCHFIGLRFLYPALRNLGSGAKQARLKFWFHLWHCLTWFLSSVKMQRVVVLIPMGLLWIGEIMSMKPVVWYIRAPSLLIIWMIKQESNGSCRLVYNKTHIEQHLSSFG